MSSCDFINVETLNGDLAIMLGFPPLYMKVCRVHEGVVIAQIPR